MATNMANSTDWQVQPAKFGGKELYISGEFLPCWDMRYGNGTVWDYLASRNGYPPYPYVPDELKCRTFRIYHYDFNQQRLFKYANHVASKRPSIQLSQLTHFTKDERFELIEKDQTIKAFPKEHGLLMGYPLVWTTATVGSNGADTIRQSIGHRRQEICHSVQYDSDPQEQFDFTADGSNYATSIPFTFLNHPCGRRRFVFNMDDLIDNYRRSICPDSGCQYRCMGTFVYKKEVMFAVLVHPAGLNLPFFEKFPELEKDDQDSKTVVYEKDGKFYWKPFSTSARFMGVHRSVYCRWEQVAFAFYFPKDQSGFDLEKMKSKYWTY